MQFVQIRAGSGKCTEKCRSACPGKRRRAKKRKRQKSADKDGEKGKECRQSREKTFEKKATKRRFSAEAFAEDSNPDVIYGRDFEGEAIPWNLSQEKWEKSLSADRFLMWRQGKYEMKRPFSFFLSQILQIPL